MKIEDFDKSIFIDLKKVILNRILIFVILGGFFSGIIHILNERPLINIFSALGVSCFGLILYYFNKRDYDFVRIVFILFFVNLYIPFGWLTSPGSTSAFPYFVIFFIVVASLLIKNYIELIFPVVGILEVIFLIKYEALNPDKFYQYTDRIYRANDLIVNFILVMSFSVYLLFVINRYTIKRDKILYNYSTTDQLTGLFNRRYLFETLDMLYMKSEKTHAIFSLAMIDVNKFKEINDSFGHVVGDKVLLSLGKLLQDFYPNEIIVGRYGGDEFMLIFPNKNLEDVSPYLTQLEGRFAILSKEFYDINLSFSFGVSDNSGKNIEEMIHIADKHLYKKKNIKI